MTAAIQNITPAKVNKFSRKEAKARAEKNNVLINQTQRSGDATAEPGSLRDNRPGSEFGGGMAGSVSGHSFITIPQTKKIMANPYKTAPTAHWRSGFARSSDI
ncbi:MAG TPA: hypothetical protein PKG95_11245 [Anaerolineaceae bacterium]|nr:hypothetical protein [Anaerolineaceae bacterium]